MCNQSQTNLVDGSPSDNLSVATVTASDRKAFSRRSREEVVSPYPSKNCPTNEPRQASKLGWKDSRHMVVLLCGPLVLNLTTMANAQSGDGAENKLLPGQCNLQGIGQSQGLTLVKGEHCLKTGNLSAQEKESLTVFTFANKELSTERVYLRIVTQDGTPLWNLMIHKEPLRLPSGLLLIPSKIGLLLSGGQITKRKGGKGQVLSHSCISFAIMEGVEDKLNFKGDTDGDSFAFSVPKNPMEMDFSKLFELEHIGNRDDPCVKDDDKALQIFNDSVKFHDGRFFVCWPWIESNPQLDPNLSVAQKRLTSVLKSLKEDPELMKRYSDVFALDIRVPRRTRINRKGPGSTDWGSTLSPPSSGDDSFEDDNKRKKRYPLEWYPLHSYYRPLLCIC